MHTIHEEQIIPTTLAEAWAFISDPHNLNTITPDSMDFHILSDLPQEMYEGLLVTYQVKIPLFGRRIWVSELKHIHPESSFVDEQRIGPYRFWYHYHGIQAKDEGVKFVDHVTYQMPFGILGEIVHVLLVKRMLQRIFSFRKEALQEIFT